MDSTVLSFHNAFGKRRAFVRRVHFVADQADARFRIGFADRFRRGVGGHAAADDQVVVTVFHRVTPT